MQMKAVFGIAVLVMVFNTAHACTTGATAVKCDSGCLLQNSTDVNTKVAAQSAADAADMCAGSGVTVWTHHSFPGGESMVYHYFTTTASPVQTTSQLIDDGYESEHEQTVVPPLHDNSEGGEWFNVNQWISDQPELKVCADSFCFTTSP